MIITITLNPAIDKTATVEELIPNGLNRLENVMINAGGKGVNVSKTINAIGGQSVALGFVAGSTGQYIEQVLDEHHIHHDFVHVDGITRTNLKVLNKNMELTELNEVGPEIKQTQIEALKHRLQSNVDKDDIVVFSGSAPRGVDKSIYFELGTIAKSSHARVILDADGELFKKGLKAEPDVIKPNKYELCQYFNVSEDITDGEMLNLAKSLLKDGIKMIVISMGKDGAYFVDRNHVAKVDALHIKAHSSVGAGDAMVAALAYAMEKNYDLRKTIRLAVACSAGAVMTKGTNPANSETVMKLMDQVEIRMLEETNEN